MQTSKKIVTGLTRACRQSRLPHRMPPEREFLETRQELVISNFGVTAFGGNCLLNRLPEVMLSLAVCTSSSWRTKIKLVNCWR